MSAEDRVRLLNEILLHLEAPLTSEEKQHGWHAESKRAALRYFTDLKEKLQSGQPLPPLDIVRGLDHWGVTGGDLLKSVATLAKELDRS